MNLLIDLFGYIGILLHGLAVIAQSIMLGSSLFLYVLIRPLVQADPGHIAIEHKIARLAIIAALVLIGSEVVIFAMQAALLMSTVNLSLGNVLHAHFATAGIAKSLTSLALVLCLLGRRRISPCLLLLAGLAELAAASLTTHAFARLDHNGLLLAAEWLHQLGAAIWIGGIPGFLIALNGIQDLVGWRAVGPGFSRISMLGVCCIVLSGATMSVFFIGDLQGFYGTAYGLMVLAKIVMFLGLLALGYGNLRSTERLRQGESGSILRMKRFAEVEIGIGFTICLAAASLTSAPPAVDLTIDRVSLDQIVARNTPQWPRLKSPEHSQLAIIQLQHRLNVEAASTGRQATPASVPGSDIPPPRNAEDIAWSEYNHHWAGLFVLLIGLVALLHRVGVRWLRHWPVLFFLLAVFLLIRSDPEVWPLGHEDFMASWRDVEVAQHRFFVVLVVLLGAYEWAVRTGRLKKPGAALVFPLLVAGGGAMLLTHQHQISNVKDQLLIELTHTPMALLSVAAGWSRWLELRLPGRGGRIGGWVWPGCFIAIALILLNYREA